jgi:hypothetical protein
MKVTILHGNGERIVRSLSGKVTMERVIAGPVDHLRLTVPKSRVDRVQRWLTAALSTIQRWDQNGHIWFDVQDKTRDSTQVPFFERRFTSLGYALTNQTVLHVEANKPRKRSVDF